MRRFGLALVALGLVGSALAAAAVLYLQGQGVVPRTLAPYIERRSDGHNAAITGIGYWLGAQLRRLDRGDSLPQALPELTLGAQGRPAQAASGGTRVAVDSTGAALNAFAAARPGDIIVFAPGSYRFERAVHAARAGTQDAPVTVRAEKPGTVVIAFDAVEGFVVRAPHWRFENLTLRGACRDDSKCEHAFHVVGEGAHFAALNNTILDFNAHIKINGDGKAFPDHGLIEGNTLTNTRPRRTANPVTPIDLVAASDWTVRANLIADFIKAGGDRISYGGFAKGAGARTLFERNVVWCEARLRGYPGQRVGLSLGGGGTGKPYCRDRQCVAEQEGGILRDNLIAACSDVGIYVNNAADSRIEHNTLVDTTGIDVRFPASSAWVDGNLVDGPVSSRNDGLLRLGDNRSSALGWSYLGRHPVRGLLRDWDNGDLRWDGAAPLRAPHDVARPDLCGKPRAERPAYGAFEDFTACLAPATSSSKLAN